MAKKNNLTCVICGTKYSFCPVCSNPEDLNKPMWLRDFHDENCRSLYYIWTAYTFAHSLTKTQVRKKLEKYDFSDIENYNPKIRAWIEEMLGSGKSKKEDADDYANPDEEAEG